MRYSTLMVAALATASFAALATADPVTITGGPIQNVAGQHPGNLFLAFMLSNLSGFAVVIDSIGDGVADRSVPNLTYSGKQDAQDIAQNPVKTGGACGSFAANIYVLDEGAVNPIPEPASLLAIGAGLVGLGLVRRRRA